VGEQERQLHVTRDVWRVKFVVVVALRHSLRVYATCVCNICLQHVYATCVCNMLIGEAALCARENLPRIHRNEASSDCTSSDLIVCAVVCP